MSRKSTVAAVPVRQHTIASERRALRRTLPPPSPSMLYPVSPDALAYLDISRKTFYTDVLAGRIQIIKRGRRSFVPGSELIRLASVAQ